MSLLASSHKGHKDSQTIWEKDWENYLAESFITPHSFLTYIKFAGALAERMYKIRLLMQSWNVCDDVEPVLCGQVMLVTG
jgi:hypothetical protein